MDRGPHQDPGEDPPPEEIPSEQGELTDLKDQFEQQQVVIAQLKEMLQKTDQTNVTQEKVDRYASTLSKMTLRAKKSKLRKEGGFGTGERSESVSGTQTPMNEKLSLLRQQLEENKAKLAERGKNQKGIEEMVTQLKAQFDDSLHFINDASSNFSFTEHKAEYSHESSSEELYNILVIKEKRISDLSSKVQKLEANVFDLQENLKEKDCVIDAKTKAITLMSESLSKKGKNTQDTLDETKEQMRNMQEDFIKLENEMKARQIKLLDDLRLKNLEIAELQEMNDKINSQSSEISDPQVPDNTEEINEMKKEIEDLLEKIQHLEASNSNLSQRNEDLVQLNNKIQEDHEKQLEELKESFKLSEITSKEKIIELENVIEKLNKDISQQTEGKSNDQSDEVNKLKKDLDDFNKNMIKVKAEHKKKIKMLNKKIDSFKKMGDLNAHIVKLSAENDTLKEKIAELEEEKGNYQLKMMDSFSKESPSGENMEELELKINELNASLAERMKELEDIQSENVSLKQQIELSNEKLKTLSDLQNEKVTSEMTSIQFEELSEKLQREKNEILSAKERLQVENEELLEKIESLNKEKIETQSKLDHYIQENIELLDRLEKLSAEKVSSAESIEIVENLTHQEKLELEEYQKNLDPQSGKMKMSEEHLEGTPDLRDSVNQLTEETSELLQKIELFTVERREVMEKMESLASENSNLNLKLKQIENNRDLLTETYEQLQSEKEDLDNQIERLKKENMQLKENIEAMKKDYNISENEDLNKKLYDLEGEYIKLGEENEKLHKELKEKSEILHEKDGLETKLKESVNKIEELRRELMESQEEISSYHSVIEDNKEEFIKSARNINELKEIITAKEEKINEYKIEIDNLNSTINDFNKTVQNLENENKDNKDNIDRIEFLEGQLDSLKKSLNENLGQIGDYENELEENSNLIKELNHQMKQLSNKNLELQNILDVKNDEHNKIIIELNEEIKRLKQQISSKDEMFHQVSSEMKEKFLTLQKQTDSNSESLEDIREPLQKKIEELTNKNTALVQKMKKLAANLKVKTQTCQDFQQMIQTNQEQFEKEKNEKDGLIKEKEQQIEALKVQADMYEIEIKQLKYILDEKAQEDAPQTQAIEVRSETHEAVEVKGEIPQTQAIEVRSEMSLQEELSLSCIVPETISKSIGDTSFSKIQELELIIETQENDIRNYKERISGLEEMLAEIDERRESLEQKTTELGVQLLEKSQSFEEISKTEDILEEKLKKFAMYKEDVEKKLVELSKDNETLLTENKKLKQIKEKLKQKLIVSQERVNELLQVQQNAAILEEELGKTKNQINHLEQEVRRLEHEKLQLEESSKLDLEKLDSDWQLQFQALSKEKTDLTVFCEKLNEKIAELQESESVLSDKIVEFESKLQKSYELQEMSDQELTTQREEIQKLKVTLEERNKEIESFSVELKSSKENEKQITTKLDGAEKENIYLRNRFQQLVDESFDTDQLLKQTQEELNQVKVTNDELQNQLKTTEEELQNKLQSQSSTQIEESEKVRGLFAWPDKQEDPFSFVSSQPTQEIQQEDPFGVVNVENQLQLAPGEHVEENRKEDLLQKIRTLEFMLKNVENERDEVLNQCSHLSNELMRLVYEKEGQQKVQEQVVDGTSNIEPVNEPACVKKTAYLCYPDGTPQDGVLSSIESSVLPGDFTRDTEESRAELQRMEFAKSKDIVDNVVTPFGEELCLKKDAYLCHPEEKSTVDSQVLASAYFQDSKDSHKELQALEFEKVKEFVEHTHPVQEAACHKKEAYVCQPDQVTLDSFGEDDDGWGWNPEEAKLEEQHNKEFEENPLRMKIVQLEDKIKEMEIERQSRNKEYQDLQVKSGKLIKKLKELKSKNEKLQQGKKQEDDDMFNLENAIQEELKTQVESLEKRISEVNNELSKEKNEKQTLQKKIETLSQTSQRLSEMKEKQDIEMLMWQRKVEDLKSKLDQFEWGDNGGSPEKLKKTDQELSKITEGDVVRMRSTIDELNETIRELTLDNEDLQALLEEQRTLRITAEKSKSVEPIAENMKTETEYMDVVNQKQRLEEELSQFNIEKKKLQDELNEIIKKNDEQLEDLRKLYDEKIQLENIIGERDEMLKNLSLNLEQLKIEKSQDEVQTKELLQKIRDFEENQDQSASQQAVKFFNEKGALLEELHQKTRVVEDLQYEREKLLQDLSEKEIEIQNLKLSVEDKTVSLKNDLEDQKKNIEKIMQENENLIDQKIKLEEELRTISHSMEVEFEAKLGQVNAEWQILVDQRGSDVAESWKLHLDSRETEFGLIQEQLRKEINDLEEKCNVLVNENNELRKNVDTEIRNEVDRMSALQQQISERQQYIHELSQAINDKQLQLEKVEQQIIQLQSSINELQKTMDEKDVKINELQIIVDATQKQFDEKRIIVEFVVKKLEERSSTPILFDLESITKELEKQLGNAVNQEELSRLHMEISDKDSIISNIQNEVALKREEVNNYQITVQNYETTIENLKQQILISNSEEQINELRANLNEKEILLSNVQDELNAKLEEVKSSVQTIEHYKIENEENRRLVKELNDKLLEKDDLISRLTYDLQQTQSLKENENENVQNLQYSLQQYQLQYDELRSNLDEKSSLIDVLNEELEKQHQIHLEREAEIKNFKMYVEEILKSHEFEKDQLLKDKNGIIETQSQEIDLLRSQLNQTQLSSDDIRSEKEMAQESVNYLQSQVQEQNKNIEELRGQIESYRVLNDQLSQKLNEYEQLQKQYQEQNVLLSEEDKQMAELKAIIEDQVLKIEELKQELYEKSNDYDSLIAEMDVRKHDLKASDHVVSTRPPMGQGQLIGPQCEDDLNEWVSRPELDIALYMLHQRDVRCEELTVELTQLLEERDTLQLRLSNALREKEEYRRNLSESGKISDIPAGSREGSPPKGATPKGRVSEIVLKSSGTELATEAQETLTKEPESQLEHKLSELKNIGYKRDKTLLDEQQQRRLQQLSIMQQHMDEASRLPPEAAARLVDADYTLSRDVQSPSKVLLNWLWGRSTPKVNEL